MGIAAVVIYSVMLLIIAVNDIKKHLIPNKVVYPGMAIALVLSWQTIGVLVALIGAGVLPVLMLVPIVFRIKMGMGDYKLGVLLGLMVGFPHIIMVLLFTGIISVQVSLYYFIIKRRKKSKLLPFGAFMAIAGIITLIFGGVIWEWIQSLQFSF